jgi:hypothetical protein
VDWLYYFMKCSSCIVEVDSDFVCKLTFIGGRVGYYVETVYQISL